MKNNFVPQRPKWFRPKNAMQEDTVASMEQGYRDLNAMQHKRFEDAKRIALPKISEMVRDWDARSDAQVTGHLRPWSDNGAYERIARNKWKRAHPILNVLNFLFPFFPELWTHQ